MKVKFRPDKDGFIRRPLRRGWDTRWIMDAMDKAMKRIDR